MTTYSWIFLLGIFSAKSLNKVSNCLVECTMWNVQKHIETHLQNPSWYLIHTYASCKVHKRCVAVGINRLWLGMFVFEGSGFITACAWDCMLLSVHWLVLVLDVLSNQLHCIIHHSKVCLSLHWDLWDFFDPQGWESLLLAFCHLLCCLTWM